MPAKINTYKWDYSVIHSKIAIVASEFNSHITEILLKGSLETLLKRGIRENEIDLYWVPGGFEVPITCKRIFQKKNIDGIITLGAVIRGETPHFDHIAGECARGIRSVSIEFGKPVTFGILTVDNMEQAMNRAGMKYGNKGSEAAHTLLNLLIMYQNANI